MLPERHNRAEGSASGQDQSVGRHDFSVAIICALPLELNALIYLFDERYKLAHEGQDPSPAVEVDPNQYTTGRIGKHYVVVVLLPGMGKVATASATAVLKTSYPNVQLTLVVGICGGVPGPHKNGDEVWLGDVVISDALVQHDLGRQYPGGNFVRKSGLQDNLPRLDGSLRAWLKTFATDHSRDKLEQLTAQYLDELQTKYTQRARRRPARYKYPGLDQDELFESSYRHRHRKSACCNDQTTCERALDASCDELGCEKEYLVSRDSQVAREADNPGHFHEIGIHIGPVASGDTVMKSGEDRDRIAADHGILAFEMEAAGAWEKTPCLVVKGVCDYADSHKNKRFQDYAAATAAAVTKALLALLGEHAKAHFRAPQCEMLALVDMLQRQGAAPRGAANKPLQFMQFAFQHRLLPQVQFHSVLVIDACGRNMPIYLETINSKELFIELLRFRFKDFGITKIERDEWSLEDVDTGQTLDLSQPWQPMLRRAKVLRMNMDFRRPGFPTTECPTVCGVTYRRIEEVQEIDVKKVVPASETASSPPRPLISSSKPLAQPNLDREISRYKHVRVIDTRVRLRTDYTSYSDEDKHIKAHPAKNYIFIRGVLSRGPDSPGITFAELRLPIDIPNLMQYFKQLPISG